MDKTEFSKELIKLASKINIDISQEESGKFYTYMNLLIEWNEKINLTAITEPNEIITKHFIDSLIINRYIKGYTSIIDVGTGAGFPGIPLKIINTDIKMVLLDSLNKRLKFINEVIKENKLENIETIHARVEESGRNLLYREKFDVAVSRAVANMNILAEYLLPLVKMNGICIFMKGSNIEELEHSKNAIKILGGEIEKIEEINLPNSDIKRNIIIVKKVKNTPKLYPRKSGIPTKKPLL